VATFREGVGLGDGDQLRVKFWQSERRSPMVQTVGLGA
jgi:hypothetical protein